MKPAELNDLVRFKSSNDTIEGRVVKVGPSLVVLTDDGKRWVVGSGDVYTLR
jgi:hypothetical protein